MTDETEDFGAMAAAIDALCDGKTEPTPDGILEGVFRLREKITGEPSTLYNLPTGD